MAYLDSHHSGDTDSMRLDESITGEAADMDFYDDEVPIQADFEDQPHLAGPKLVRSIELGVGDVNGSAQLLFHGFRVDMQSFAAKEASICKGGFKKCVKKTIILSRNSSRD